MLLSQTDTLVSRIRLSIPAGAAQQPRHRARRQSSRRHVSDVSTKRQDGVPVRYMLAQSASRSAPPTGSASITSNDGVTDTWENGAGFAGPGSNVMLASEFVFALIFFRHVDGEGLSDEQWATNRLHPNSLVAVCEVIRTTQAPLRPDRNAKLDMVGVSALAKAHRAQADHWGLCRGIAVSASTSPDVNLPARRHQVQSDGDATPQTDIEQASCARTRTPDRSLMPT